MKKNIFVSVMTPVLLASLLAAGCGNSSASSSATSQAVSAASEAEAASSASSEAAESVVSSVSDADTTERASSLPDNMLDQVSSSQTFDVPELAEALDYADIDWSFTPDSMKKALGEPTSVQNDAYTYDGCSLEGYTGSVTFFYQDDKLTSTRWTFEAASLDDLNAATDAVKAFATKAYGDPVSEEEHLTNWANDDYQAEAQQMLSNAPTLYYKVMTSDAVSDAAQVY